MARFNRARQERLKRRGKQAGDDIIDENGEINLQAEMEEMTRAVEKMKNRLAIRNAASFHKKKRRRSLVEKEEIKAFFRWKWENATGEESDWMGQTNVRKIMMMVEKEYDYKKAKDPNWRPENMAPITPEERAQMQPHKTLSVSGERIEWRIRTTFSVVMARYTFHAVSPTLPRVSPLHSASRHFLTRTSHSTTPTLHVHTHNAGARSGRERAG